MPSQTRDQKFKKSFQLFFDHISGDDIYPELKEYDLINIPYDCRKRILSTSNYQFILPRKIVDYHIDVFLVDENGIINPPGPVMKEQFIPAFSDLKRNFDHYYDQYRIFKDHECVANVAIKKYFYENKKNGNILDEDQATVDLSDYDLKVNICVNYYKSEVPYPVPLTTKQQFEKRCIELEKRNQDLEKDIEHISIHYDNTLNLYNNLRYTIRTDRRETENKYRTMFEKMQKKFSEYYSEKKEKDNCPVCYEIIDSEKLRVPGCCHTICTDCAGRCNKCPICRETY